MLVNITTLNVSKGQKFEFDRSKRSPNWKKGLYAYRWDVLTQTGDKWSLAGISSDIASRLSSYISKFNRELTARSSALERLVHDPQTKKISVQVFGPYGRFQDPQELERDFILRIPISQRLNKTAGGNGGGSWHQYDHLPPSQGVFLEQETPEKYYPIKDKGTHIAPEFTPSIRDQSGVYVIKKRATPDDKEDMRYIGSSAHVDKRIRTHCSKASHLDEDSPKVAQAIAQDPESFVFGLLPSTKGVSPRTMRRAEKHHIDRQKPSLNTNRGGGGPTTLKRRLVFDDMPE